MKKECEIVQDLLFGYVDGTLKNASKELVDKHLVECDECRMLLNELKGDKKVETEDTQEIDYLKKIKHKINKKTVIITIVSILLAIIVVLNIIVYLNYRDYAEEMEIFFNENVTEKELEDVKNAVLETADNVYIEYNSSKDALENLKRQMGDNAYLLDGYEEDKENIFPSSYTLRANLDKIEEIKEKVEKMPGVKTVTTHTNINPYILLYAELFLIDNK